MDAKFLVEERLKDVGFGNTVLLWPSYYPHIHRKLTCHNVIDIQNETRQFHDEVTSLLEEKFPIEVKTSNYPAVTEYFKTVMFNPDEAFNPINAINYYPTANTPNLVFLPCILEEDGSLKFIAFDSLKEYSLAFLDINPAIEYAKKMVSDNLDKVAITLLDLNEFTEKVDLEGRHVKVIGDGRYRIAGYAITNEKVMEYNERSREVPLSFFPFVKRDYTLKDGEVLSLTSHSVFSVIVTYSKEDSDIAPLDNVARYLTTSASENKTFGMVDCYSVYEEPDENNGRYLYCFFTKQLKNTPSLLLPAYVIREMVNVIAQDIKEKDKRYSLTDLVDRNRRVLFGIIEDFISNKEIVHFDEDESISLEERKYNKRRLYRRINQ